MAKRKLKKILHMVGGTIIFLLLIGSAFAIDVIFGFGFIINFFIAIYKKILEKNFLIPVFIFVGALIIRYALSVILPSVLNAQSYFSLGVSLLLFLSIIFVGWKIKKSKIKI